MDVASGHKRSRRLFSSYPCEWKTSSNTSLPSIVMAHPIKYIQIRRISDCSTILKSIILQMFGSIYNHFHLQQEQHFQLLCFLEPAPSFSASVLYIHTICILQKERFLAPIKQILLHCTNKWPRFPFLHCFANFDPPFFQNIPWKELWGLPLIFT